MIIITDECLDVFADVAIESSITMRALPHILLRLEQSNNYVVKLDYRGGSGVGRTSWYKAIDMLCKRGVIVRRRKSDYVVNKKFIRKSPTGESGTE